MDLQLEEEFLAWIEGRHNMLRFSPILIMCKAKAMYDKKVCDKEFKASNGWFKKVLNQKNLFCHLKKPKTTKAKKDSPQLISKLVANVIHAGQLSKGLAFGSECIIVMDETAVWSTKLSNATVSESGKEDVSIKSGCHKKDRVSVCQTTQANSKEESKALSDEFSHNYALKSSPIVWMNKRLTVEWVQSGLEHFHSNADYYHGILLIVI